MSIKQLNAVAGKPPFIKKKKKIELTVVQLTTNSIIIIHDLQVY